MKRPTLLQTFVFAYAILLALLALVFFIFIRGSGHTVLESSERVRNEASREIVSQVSDYLNQASRVSDSLEQSIDKRAIDQDNWLSLEAGIYSLLISNPNIQEITLTYGKATGFDDDGEIELLAQGRGQLSVYRDLGGGLSTRQISVSGKRFISRLKRRSAGGDFQSGSFQAEDMKRVEDPTEHPTFTTPANHDFLGKMLWSDLHFSPLEVDLPESKRHTRVSVQKALYNGQQKFIGVLRVAITAAQIDRITEFKFGESPKGDPHRVFLCDAQGRLITRFSPEDVYTDMDGELRVTSHSLPPEVGLALKLPALATVDSSHPLQGGRFEMNGHTYLTTFRALGETQSWIAGIVVPESYYLGSLENIRRETLWAAFVVMLFILAGGILLLRGVLSAQSQIVRETGKMNRFDFTPALVRSAFSDVNDSLEGLEKAKSAMRALGKYAPIDLVRKLYQEKREPRLGGELTMVSMMFTDIADFTTISEKLEPNVLAQSLGMYLEKMVGIIQNQMDGTIDKFIGDAIMAIWNAPTPVKQDAVLACRAALECQQVAKKLFESDAWRGLPILDTRIGLHRDKVLVGHFGAPERMNYTALGDGVNLASRLEGLNKAYGTKIIVSQAIRDEAIEHFDFRLLDLVAVKGKNNGITVFELLGPINSVSPDLKAQVEIYEEAFELYLSRNFTDALELLQKIPLDPPARALALRCAEFLKSPPSSAWFGIHNSAEK